MQLQIEEEKRSLEQRKLEIAAAEARLAHSAINDHANGVQILNEARKQLEQELRDQSREQIEAEKARLLVEHNKLLSEMQKNTTDPNKLEMEIKAKFEREYKEQLDSERIRIKKQYAEHSNNTRTKENEELTREEWEARRDARRNKEL